MGNFWERKKALFYLQVGTLPLRPWVAHPLTPFSLPSPPTAASFQAVICPDSCQPQAFAHAVPTTWDTIPYPFPLLHLCILQLPREASSNVLMGESSLVALGDPPFQHSGWSLQVLAWFSGFSSFPMRF